MAQHIILIVVDSEMVNKSQASLEANANRFSSDLSVEYSGHVENHVMPITAPEFDVAEQDTISDMIAELQEIIQDTKDEIEDEGLEDEELDEEDEEDLEDEEDDD